MRARLVQSLLILSWPACLALTGGIARGQAPLATLPATGPVTTLPAELGALVDQLGDEDYRRRAAATRRLLEAGEELIPALRARLATESDAEIRFRLRFVLENIQPPLNAALVVRAAVDSGLQPGDLVTHVDNRRVRSRAELLRRLRDAPGASWLRVRGPVGPREVGPVTDLDLPTLSDYRAPRGERVVRVLQLYHGGYAERAYELLRAWDAPPPAAEFSPLLHAIVAYTAGDAATAYELLADCPEASPPLLDTAGPQEAPLQLAWRLWNESGRRAARPDPDTAVQRVLVPANRFMDVLESTAESWWSQYRGALGTDSNTDRIGGNMLAVSAWMLSELELLSESLRLIEPRSAILRESAQGVHKWVRVRSDAWLPFVRGDPRGALDGFYEDARTILQPPGPPLSRRHIQNPRVAAVVAFFLYQFPDDQRVSETLALVNRPGYPALQDYAYWMLFGLGPHNFDAIRQHLLAVLPNAAQARATDLALAVALLEYVSGRPDPAALTIARQRVADTGSDPQTAGTAAIIMALEQLGAGRAREAQQVLASAGDEPGAAVLRATADFIAAPPDTFSSSRLPPPLLAVPLGGDRRAWLLVTRDRRLARFDVGSGVLTPIERPTPTWFPGPLNWPWLGHESHSGRSWVYARRRVAEVPIGDSPALRLNIHTTDIAAFDRYVGPAFSTLAAACLAHPVEPDESGEFWRADLQTGHELFADPQLPEIGLIRPLPNDPRIVQVGLRGGPHLLLDTTVDRAWTSAWIAEQLGLAAPPWFLAQAACEQPTPLIFLFSDVGLIRFDVAEQRLTRLTLPGERPYPALVPESCPYARRDSRWVYFARLPREGGSVFRVRVGDDDIAVLDMVNQVLPRDYYALQARGELRAQIDAAFAGAGLPSLQEFIADAQETVSNYIEEDRP